MGSKVFPFQPGPRPRDLGPGGPGRGLEDWAVEGSGLEIEEQRSAGGLVVRRGSILLISRFQGRRWQLPKGRLEADETDEMAALREVREETGVRASILGPAGQIRYFFVEQDGRRIQKDVLFFLMEYDSGSTDDYDPEEVSGAAWFSWLRGLEILSFENERQVVGGARELYRDLRRQALARRRQEAARAAAESRVS